MARDKRITMGFTAEEHQAIQDLATTWGYKQPGEFLRMMLDRALDLQADPIWIAVRERDQELAGGDWDTHVLRVLDRLGVRARLRKIGLERALDDRG